jgi:hypothetical protein
VGESRRGRSGDGDVVVFGGSDGLWISLAALAVLAVPLTLWVAALDWQSDGPGASGAPLAIGGLIALVLGFGARFAWRERREVVLDAAGITVRAGDGRERARIPWAEIVGFEERRLPTQPLRPALMIHRVDGTVLLIDPQQVRDIGALAREARQRLARVGLRG